MADDDVPTRPRERDAMTPKQRATIILENYVGARDLAEQIERAITEALQAQREADDRDARQKRVAEWCAAAFGAAQAASVEQRGLRLLEEAIEAYQAAGCNREQAHKLVDYVFARPPGKLSQELGGVGITTLALANACGASADAEEVRELNRVLSKPLVHFAARNQAKNDAGFAAIRDVK
jgi:hypothetical protein